MTGDQPAINQGLMKSRSIKEVSVLVLVLALFIFLSAVLPGFCLVLTLEV